MSWMKRITRQRIIVHTTANLSVEGLLVEMARDGLVLKTAKMLGPDTDLAGDVFIPREQVAFVQLPG